MAEQKIDAKTLIPLSEADEQRLTEIVAEMRQEPYWQPGNSQRLSKAERLYRLGGVVYDAAAGVFHVQGSDDGQRYDIVRTCPCAHSQHRDDRWCYHRNAAVIYCQMHRLRLEGFAIQGSETGAPLTRDHTLTRDEHQDMPRKAPESPREPISGGNATPESTDGPSLPTEPVGSQKTAYVECPTVVTLPATLTSRSITAIIADLSRPFRAAVATKTVSGTLISYLHWQSVARLLDAYAPGWTGEVTRIEHHGQTLRVIYRLGIPCAEGIVWREATGEDDEWGDDEEKRFGNPSANAQANAFKRAAALFGCGQWLYDKKDDPTASGLAEYFKQEKQAAIIDLGKALLAKGMDRKQALDWLKTKAGVTSIDQIPIVAIKTMLSYVIESPEVHDDLREYPEGWLTESEKRRLAEQL